LFDRFRVGEKVKFKFSKDDQKVVIISIK
jgi:hypothetical protein